MMSLHLRPAVATIGPRPRGVCRPRPRARFLFALNNPPGSNLIQQAMTPWIERFNAKAAGTIKIEPRAGFVLTNFTNYYDRVQEDVVQIGWGLQNAIGGKFPLTEVATLPWGEASAEVLSVALWRLVKSGLVDCEYADTVPLLMNIFPLGGIHFVAPPPAVDDYRGLKIQTSGKIQSEVVQTLRRHDTSPYSRAKSTKSLQRRTINATSTGWVAFGAFKLNEVTAYHIDNVPKATSVGQVIMSQKKYNSLPPAGAEGHRRHDIRAGNPDLRRLLGPRQRLRARQDGVAARPHHLRPARRREFRNGSAGCRRCSSDGRRSGRMEKRWSRNSRRFSSR